MKKKNSLQFKAVMLISFIFITLIVIVTSIEYVNSRKLILSSMEDSGKQTVTIHAQNLASWVQARLSQVEVIANTELVKSMDYPKILDYFKKEMGNYDGVFNSLGISDQTGQLNLQNNVVVDISSEETFPKVMKGEKIISNPFQDKQKDSGLIISMECPIKDSESGTVKGLVSGACLVSTVFQKNTDFRLGKTDKVYILNDEGMVIYHPDSSLINKSNFRQSENQEFNKLVQEALTKESFIGKYKDNNQTKMLFSSYVEGTDWYIFLEVPTDEFTSSLNSLLYLIIIVSVAACLFLIFTLIIILRSFFKRLLKLSVISSEVSEGNLIGSLPESTDELGRINIAFNKMVDNLKNIILQIRNVSEVVIKSSENYKNVSLEVINSGKSMNQSIEDITMGAKITTEEIQKITLSVHDMEDKSKELVEISENIDTMINQTKDKTSNGSNNLDSTVEVLYKMRDSVDITSKSITDLSNKSNIIANITTTISSISEQTNLLALNASIEAARAGESGKGFSVVAEEIRKLAEQSSNATQGISKEIYDIQQQIINAVASMKDSINYVGLSTNSIDKMQVIFTGIEEEIEKIKNLSSSVYEVAKLLLQENRKINEAVSNTSAISEEAAASTMSFKEMMESQESVFLNLKESSEHLDEIAVSLSKEISKFRIE